MKFGRLPLSWTIAWRYFFAKKSTNAVNVISIVAVIGVALVALAMVVVLSVFNGFEDLTNQQFSELSAEFKIVQKHGEPFSASLVNVKGAAPVLTEQAIASYEDNKAVVRLIGVDVPSYLDIIHLENFMFDGDFELGTDTMPSTVIGIGVATSLGAGVGYHSPLDLSLPKRVGRVSSVMPARSFMTQSLPVAGVFRLDQPEDTEVVYIPLPIMREMLQYEEDEVSYLITSQGASGMTKNQIQSAVGSDFKVLDRYEQHPEVYKVLRVEKLISFLLLTFVLILSTFNIISSLGLLIIEKRDDTRLLGLLGARQGLVDKIIVNESWLLSISGLVIGMIVGIILVLLQQHFGFMKLSGSGQAGFIIDHYLVRLKLMDLISVIIVILGVGWISSRIAYRLFMARQR